MYDLSCHLTASQLLLEITACVCFDAFPRKMYVHTQQESCCSSQFQFLYSRGIAKPLVVSNINKLNLVMSFYS